MSQPKYVPRKGDTVRICDSEEVYVGFRGRKGTIVHTFLNESKAMIELEGEKPETATCHYDYLSVLPTTLQPRCDVVFFIRY